MVQWKNDFSENINLNKTMTTHKTGYHKVATYGSDGNKTSNQNGFIRAAPNEPKESKYGPVGKLISTLIAAILFFLIGNPFTYHLVDKIFGGHGYIAIGGS